MARLTLSPNGLQSPLDLSAPAARVAVVEPVAAEPAAPVAPTEGEVPAAVPAAEFAVVPDLDLAPAPEPRTDRTIDDEALAPATAVESTDATPAPFAAPRTAAPSASTATEAGDLPSWADGLGDAALQPDRLLGRPKQTALILDRELSTRADELVAATGPRVTFAALVIAVLHFHLPADGTAAAKAIGGYRRRKLESLDHPWEERNARLPEPLRAELDDVVSGAVGRVASVRRSTLVNALLDAHLPATADDAARLVTRMEMVRGGAFLV